MFFTMPTKAIYSNCTITVTIVGIVRTLTQRVLISSTWKLITSNWCNVQTTTKKRVIGNCIPYKNTITLLVNDKTYSYYWHIPAVYIQHLPLQSATPNYTQKPRLHCNTIVDLLHLWTVLHTIWFHHVYS